jgi:hypothetical protein
MVLKFNFKPVVRKKCEKYVFLAKCLEMGTRLTVTRYLEPKLKRYVGLKSQKIYWIGTLSPSIGTVVSFILFMSQKVGPLL